MRYLLGVLVLAATIACTVADNQCSGNIVDALSQCASAIQGGEPLDSQQQKCTPNGCNYDCPSVDLINDLQSDLTDANTRIDTLQQYAISLAANGTQSINQLQDYIGNVQNYAQSNNQNIQGLQGDVSSLQDYTQSNDDTIGTLQGDVSTLQDYTQSNDDTIASLQTKQDNNTARIDSINTKVSDIPTSCQDVKTMWPGSPSGNYLISLPNGDRAYVYCNLGTLCGDSDGWLRIGYLDMKDPAQDCPDSLQLLTQDNVRCCGRTNTGAGCGAIFFDSKGYSYSKVCGRVTGYQWGSPDWIGTSGNIDSHYVEGVSITYGDPRQHLWTFIATIREGINHCPCANSAPTPDFIGDNYYCESGNSGSGWSKTLYTGDPIWDGLNCRSTEANCCNPEGLPWFYRELDSAVSDDIELRVCGDQGIGDEDNPVESYEIYIK